MTVLRIFVSYETTDAAFATQLMTDLRETNAQVITDNDRQQMEDFFMADTVSKQNNDHFANQAQLHRNVADHTRQMISQHSVFHDNLLSATQSTRLSDAAQSYTSWWEAFSKHLLNHADLHEKAAAHLEKSVSSFDDTDTNIQQSFTQE